MKAAQTQGTHSTEGQTRDYVRRTQGTEDVTRMQQSMTYAQAQADLANAESDLRAELARKGAE
jgi:hypothetical protein